MRFPSLSLLAQGAATSFGRFPFVMVVAIVACGAGMMMIEDDYNDIGSKILLSAQLGIPLLFAVNVWTERRDWGSIASAVISVAGLLLLLGYYLSLPAAISTPVVLRYAQLNVALHLLVAFLPFARTSQINGFWQYNKTLFLRFLTAVLYSAVLFAGLAVALAAIDKLLGVNIDDKTYLRLWIAIATIFNTWFFVGGVPDDVDTLESVDHYPKGLKVFTQYVLIPLVVIYLVILTMYLVKISVTRVWPSGWIGYLVSSVSTAGILALLLVHPIKDRSENKWVSSFSRGFYIFLIPAIIMLLLAIYKRIDQYGVTEMRYFLLIIALWLAGMALYFIFSRAKNIKVIPTTLCIVAFATSFGPWGAYAVSERSQVARLQGILEDTSILQDGLVQNAPSEIEFEDRREISAILRYLAEHHGLEKIDHWFDGGLAAIDTVQSPGDLASRGQSTERARLVMEHMGITYIDRWAQANSEHFNFAAARQNRPSLLIAGHQYYISLTQWHTDQTYPLGEADYNLVYNHDGLSVQIEHGDSTLLTLRLGRLLERVGDSSLPMSVYEHPIENLHIEEQNGAAHIEIYFEQLSGQRTEDGVKIQHFNATCFVTIK